MKKMYEKPFAKKVAFSYEDQVVAASGNYEGNVNNRDNTGSCQFTASDCNYFWNSVSRSMNDCTTNPPA